MFAALVFLAAIVALGVWIYRDRTHPSWHDLFSAGQDAYNRSEYAVALTKLEPALAGAERDRSTDPKTLAAVIDWLALTERHLANHDKAEALFRRELPLNESAYGKNSLDYVSNLLDIEQTLAELGKDAERTPLLEEANAILAKLPTSNDSDRKRALALHELASLRYNQGRDKEAEELWKQAVAIRFRLDGEKSTAAATTLVNLATFASNYHYRSEEAVSLYERALGIFEAKNPDSDDVGFILLHIANIKRKSGAKSDEIIALYRRALTIYEHTYGSDNKQLIEPLTGLCRTLENSKQYQEAITLRLRLLALIEKYGAEDEEEDVADQHGFLAKDYAALGDKANAQRHKDIAQKLWAEGD